MSESPDRRDILILFAVLATATFAAPATPALAEPKRQSFPAWVEAFRSRARARGISDSTYTSVMAGLEPDTRVYALDRAQPEFREVLWQYLNRRVSDWRIRIGKQRAEEHAGLLGRIEKDFGVDRHVMLGLWGMESAYGEVIDNPNHMRPVMPALAALAWGEPRRRTYWERELLNALVIIDRGWGKPAEMLGSWAGAMGHTQWMPEVWLNMGLDYDRDGRISPFGKPDDALAGTAQFLLKRGRYVRGQPWGYEVRAPASLPAQDRTMAPISSWQARGVVSADGRPFADPSIRARLWRPVAGGPAFLLTQNFNAVRSYNPADSYALAIVHLGDRVRGNGPFMQPFPGGERIMTIEEIQEMQRRLTAAGFDTAGTDGRVGQGTMRAVRAFQRREGLTPADGYPGLQVLTRLRTGQ